MPDEPPEWDSRAWDLAVEEEGLEWAPPSAEPNLAPIGRTGGGITLSTLPGHGSGSPTCGKWVGKWKCDTHLEARIAQRECHQRECPICAGLCLGHDHCRVGLPAHPGGKWAHKEGWAAMDRFEDFLEQHRLGRLPMRQVVFSPDPGAYSQQEDHLKTANKIRSKAEAMVRRFAWRGYYFGSAVVHLFRGCEGDYTRWGPHVHLLCAGIDVRAWESYRKSETKRGRPPRFILKQTLSRGGGWSGYRGFYLARHMVYELGHAAIFYKHQALCWFGALKTWTQPNYKGAEDAPPLCTAGDSMSLFDGRTHFDPCEEGDSELCAYIFDRQDHQERRIIYHIVKDEPPDDRPDDVLTEDEWLRRYAVRTDAEIRLGRNLPRRVGA